MFKLENKEWKCKYLEKESTSIDHQFALDLSAVPVP